MFVFLFPSAPHVTATLEAFGRHLVIFVNIRDVFQHLEMFANRVEEMCDESWSLYHFIFCFSQLHSNRITSYLSSNYHSKNSPKSYPLFYPKPFNYFFYLFSCYHLQYIMFTNYNTEKKMKRTVGPKWFRYS